MRYTLPTSILRASFQEYQRPSDLRPMTPNDEADESNGPSFRTVLIRVMLVQIITLIMLWVLQARYHG